MSLPFLVGVRVVTSLGLTQVESSLEAKGLKELVGKEVGVGNNAGNGFGEGRFCDDNGVGFYGILTSCKDSS